MVKREIKKWRDNRGISLAAKLARWKQNPVGALVRLCEMVYFGQPLFNFFIGNSEKRGNSTGIELIAHISQCINLDKTNEELIFLENVRLDLRENFIQLDTGHILNTRKTTNEIFSGQYWNQIRKIRKSRLDNLKEGEAIYAIASQKYFYHFLLEELPEIISAKNSGIVQKFISLPNQPKYVIELMELVGLEIAYMDEEIQYIENLILPTYSRSNSAWSIEQLRALKTKNSHDLIIHKKILLLRGGGARSDAHLEELLMDTLLPRGFTSVNLENFSISEQISLFENAKEIVSIHGGALSNMVFTSDDCRIFEIFSHPYRTYFFRNLSRIKGNQYANAEAGVALRELGIWLESSD